MKKRKNHVPHVPVPTNENVRVRINVNEVVPTSVNGVVPTNVNGAILASDPAPLSGNAAILPKNTKNTENGRALVTNKKKKRRESARKILIHIII